MGRHSASYAASRDGRRLKRLGALLFVVLPLALAALDAQASPRVLWLRVDGAISPASADFIADGLRAAEEQKAAALVIEIDTPGGLLTSTRTIVKALLASPVPVIAYVAPGGAGAASAGVFVVMAANIAAMAPGTNIGASTPVEGGGGDIAGAMGAKVKSFTASFAKAIAEQRGRNAQWATRAVRRAVSATDREALAKNVIDLIATDVDDLLAKADGRTVTIGEKEQVLHVAGATLVRMEMTLRQEVLMLLADPSIAYMLMLAGLLGLYLELSHPGTLVPGLVGGLCLAISLASFQILPIDTTGVLLIVLGLALLVAELFLPSFGIVGGVGVIAFVLGSLFLFDESEPGVYVDRMLIGSAAAAVGLAMLTVATLVVRAMRGRPTTGREALVGSVGEMRTRAAPRGTIFVHGEIWKAESAEPIDEGCPARVLEVDGLTLHVAPLGGERTKE
ncbi:MAG: nodulation protein NfeD [Candidatus Binatia bacterium]|nr:nodulation protein NfeD [Candidatus Binatia bacterium]